MPRKKAAQFRCTHCGQTFTMAMHLGRHMATRHGQAAAKRPAKRLGKRRPRGIVAPIDVHTLPADELLVLAKAAQLEIARRLAGLRREIG